jgi:photosystem II stability/assembly factor-like uncharacterized protein
MQAISKLLWGAIGLGLAIGSSACTFYTACPTGDGNNPATAGTGGQGTAGSSSQAGNTGQIIDGELPPGEWESVTPDELLVREYACGPAFYITSNPYKNQVILSIAGSDLFATEDGGTTWAELGTGEGSADVNNSTTAIAFEPEDPDVFWEAGMYGFGMYKTLDGGQTFERVGPLDHLDTLSIDFTDPERRTMLTTAHEQQIVHLSVDAGETWETISDGIPEGSKNCRYGHVIDAETFILSCGGLFETGSPVTLRSVDAGQTWEEVYDNGGGSPPLLHSDGSIYFADEHERGLARSTDQGLTWERVTDGTLLSVQPVELPDGRIASMTNDAVVVSDDSGATWKKVTPATPFKATGFTYSPFEKAFIIFYFGCMETQTAEGDEIQRFYFDWEEY